MATKEEFEMIKRMYFSAIGKASMKIDESIKEAKEKYGFENGSALTDCYRKDLEIATKDIHPLKEIKKYGEIEIEEAVRDEEGTLVYDKKDALKMLKAIRHINTYIL